MITRRGFFKTLLGAAAAVVVFPFKRTYRKINLDVFCNGIHGNDKNDGLTPKTSVRSLQAALDRVPNITNTLTIHMRGTFDSGIFTLPPIRE